jgi:hypothetical protein
MLLTDKVLAIYCLVVDLLQSCHHHAPAGCRCSDAEIITTALVSALLLKGNQSLAIEYMRTYNLAPALLLKLASSNACTALQTGSTIYASRWRLLPKSSIVVGCTSWIAFHWQRATTSASAGAIPAGSFGLFKGEAYLIGFGASKRRYFYRVKVQVITTDDELR